MPVVLFITGPVLTKYRYGRGQNKNEAARQLPDSMRDIPSKLPVSQHRSVAYSKCIPNPALRQVLDIMLKTCQEGPRRRAGTRQHPSPRAAEPIQSRPCQSSEAPCHIDTTGFQQFVARCASRFPETKKHRESACTMRRKRLILFGLRVSFGLAERGHFRIIRGCKR